MEKKYDFIAVDFDGTLCEHKFPEIGEAKPEVIKAVQLHAARGTKIILYTCRDNEQEGVHTGYLDAALAWCKEHDVPVHAVNENPWVPFGKGKMYADIYIDDRALNVQDLFLL